MTSTLMTFIGKSYAKKNFRFYYKGPNVACPVTCSLYATCQKNLKPGSIYEVKNVQQKEFNCPRDLHEEKMLLAEIVPAHLEVSMLNKDIYVGSVLKFNTVNCPRTDCPNHHFCTPEVFLLEADVKVKIVEKVRKIKDCPRGFHLSVVKLEKRE